jgi:hypothetical protein
VPIPLDSLTYVADPICVEYMLKTNFKNYPKVSCICRREAGTGTSLQNTRVNCVHSKRPDNCQSFAWTDVFAGRLFELFSRVVCMLSSLETG